jgi:UDP-N-acetyl-D-mannosaminuronate dehydrogenase
MVHDSFVRQDAVEFPFTDDLNSVIADSDAILVITAHQEYKDLDLRTVKAQMKNSPIIIDGRVTFIPEKVIDAGFTYRAIGRGQYFL